MDPSPAAPAGYGSVAMTEVSAPGNASGTLALVRNQPADPKWAEVGAEARGSQTASVDAESKVSQPSKPQSVSTGETRLSIAFDQASNRFVYRGIDAGTGEVVNQLPPDEALRRFAYLRELAGQQFGRAVDTSA